VSTSVKVALSCSETARNCWATPGNELAHAEITLEIDDDGCGRLEFELPLDATDEDVTYIERLEPRIESGLLELRDLNTDEVVLSCRPSLTGESLLKTATRSAVKLKH
jgi:hypothetical protein